MLSSSNPKDKIKEADIWLASVSFILVPWNLNFPESVDR